MAQLEILSLISDHYLLSLNQRREAMLVPETRVYTL